MTRHETFVYTDLGVVVVELSQTEWGVSGIGDRDGGGRDAGGASLIGVIRQTEAGFEVTEVGAPGRRSRFRTFPEALTMLSRRTAR